MATGKVALAKGVYKIHTLILALLYHPDKVSFMITWENIYTENFTAQSTYLPYIPV